MRYCLNKNLAACAGTAQTAKAQPTMFYGVPRCLKLDLFSDYEIAVSDDFAFDKLLSTIRGDVEMGADVVVPRRLCGADYPGQRLIGGCDLWQTTTCSTASNTRCAAQT